MTKGFISPINERTTSSLPRARTAWVTNMAYPYEQGVTVYCDKADIPDAYAPFAEKVWSDNDTVYKYVPVNTSGYYAAKKANFLTNTIISTATSSNYIIPSQAYFAAFDQKLLDAAVDAAKTDSFVFKSDGTKFTSRTQLTAADINPFSSPDCVGNETGVTENSYSLLRNYGYLKFYDTVNKTMWGNWKNWNVSIAETLGTSQCPNADFTTLYQNDVNNKIAQIRTCIATSADTYGHFGDSSNWEVKIGQTTWADAWHKGFLEGLIEYPVAWMVDVFARSFDPGLTGMFMPQSEFIRRILRGSATTLYSKLNIWLAILKLWRLVKLGLTITGIKKKPIIKSKKNGLLNRFTWPTNYRCRFVFTPAMLPKIPSTF